MRAITYYHWSPSSNRQSIQQHGLLTHRPAIGTPEYKASYICASRNKDIGWVLAKGRTENGTTWDCWAFTVPTHYYRSNRQAEGYDEYRIHGNIPTNRINLEETRTQ